MPMAAAYLGYADDNSPFRDQVRTLLKNGKYEEQYSFLADVPKENYISYNGEEVYAIVPQSTQYAMKVESFDWDENANAMVRDTLYISQKAAPVILKCNLSELSYNVVITLTMIMLIRSMRPEVIAVDEIGGSEDVHAIEYAMHCGCRMIATAHADSMEELQKKPVFDRLIREKRFERYVLLGNEPQIGTIQEIYDERGSLLYQDQEEKTAIC